MSNNGSIYNNGKATVILTMVTVVMRVIMCNNSNHRNSSNSNVTDWRPFTWQRRAAWKPWCRCQGSCLHCDQAVSPPWPGVAPPFKSIEYAVHRDLILLYPKPYSIYLRGSPS